ncbi:MAG: DUF4190 domain-containing protein [Verrucomicrobiales bacterium]
MMQWYYADESDQQRPVAEEDLGGLAASGVIKPGTLLWNETMADWKRAAEVRPDLFSTPFTPPVLSPVQRRDLVVSRSVVPGQRSPTDPVAVCALVFGILGLLFCGAPVFSIPGIVCGHISRRRSRDEVNPSSNGGLALAGLITGYIGLALFAVVILFYGAIFIAAIAGAGMEGLETP